MIPCKGTTSPVHGEAIVDVEFRWRSEIDTGPAKNYNWSNIEAYQVIGASSAAIRAAIRENPGGGLYLDHAAARELLDMIK